MANGPNRRAQMLKLLRERGEAVPGGELARMFGASRQIMVQDVALLRAAGEPIISTARGYLYLASAGQPRAIRTTLLVRHSAEQAGDELRALLDCGVRVVDVVVNHPVYGELRGPIMLDRGDQIDGWLRKFEQGKGRQLSELTDGVHTHTIEARSTAEVDCALRVLRERGYLQRE